MSDEMTVQEEVQPVTVADLRLDELEKTLAEIRESAAKKDAIIDELIATNKKLFSQLSAQKAEKPAEKPEEVPIYSAPRQESEDVTMGAFLSALRRSKPKNNDGM